MYEDHSTWLTLAMSLILLLASCAAKAQPASVAPAEGVQIAKIFRGTIPLLHAGSGLPCVAGAGTCTIWPSGMPAPCISMLDNGIATFVKNPNFLIAEPKLDGV